MCLLVSLWDWQEGSVALRNVQLGLRKRVVFTSQKLMWEYVGNIYEILWISMTYNYLINMLDFCCIDGSWIQISTKAGPTALLRRLLHGCFPWGNGTQSVCFSVKRFDDLQTFESNFDFKAGGGDQSDSSNANSTQAFDDQDWQVLPQVSDSWNSGIQLIVFLKIVIPLCRYIWCINIGWYTNVMYVCVIQYDLLYNIKYMLPCLIICWQQCVETQLFL